MRWAIHPDFPHYEISEECVVHRLTDAGYRPAGLVCNGAKLSSGYWCFKLVDRSGKRKQIRAGRLMLGAFVGEPPSPAHQAAHNDGNRLNNHIDNLRWATPKENQEDRLRHGTDARGEKSARAIFTDAEVVAMRSLYTGKRGELKQIADRFGKSYTAVSKAIRGECWKHLPAAKLDRKLQGAGA